MPCNCLASCACACKGTPQCKCNSNPSCCVPNTNVSVIAETVTPAAVCCSNEREIRSDSCCGGQSAVNNIKETVEIMCKCAEECTCACKGTAHCTCEVDCCAGKKENKINGSVRRVEIEAYQDQKPGTSGLRKRVTVFQQTHYTHQFIQSILSTLPPSTISTSTSLADPSCCSAPPPSCCSAPPPSCCSAPPPSCCSAPPPSCCSAPPPSCCPPPAVSPSCCSPQPRSRTIILGGDGRFFSEEAIKHITRICAANGIKKLVIGQNGLLSTPAASHLIRLYVADGGILLTASHNPGGQDGDFGIKFNGKNGGPASESVTDAIYECSKGLTGYLYDDSVDVDISKPSTSTHSGMVVEVIDSINAYQQLMSTLFDFGLIETFLKESRMKVLFDGMHGVGGPYAKRILGQLGLSESSFMRCNPLPDFGGCHPDPNLTYAPALVSRVFQNTTNENIGFGAASDGDADRNMVLGQGVFVNPSDSVAVIADWAECIPYFGDGLKGVARSMPTSAALDVVAKAKKIPCYETPTGWKYFGNLMDSSRLSLCGEESFGQGGDYIREKDGLFSVLCWLSILANANKEKQTTPEGKVGRGMEEEKERFVGVKEVLEMHWRKYGRHYFSRWDYECVETDKAECVMKGLRGLCGVIDGTVVGKGEGEDVEGMEVRVCDDFEYCDPVDGAITKHQGIRIILKNHSRIIFRLSGTGSTGATIRLYVEKYVESTDDWLVDAGEAVKGLIEGALRVSRLREITGRTKPDVVT